MVFKLGFFLFFVDGIEFVNMYILESFGIILDIVKRNKIELWCYENVLVFNEIYFIIMYFMDWYLFMLIVFRIGLL